MEKYPPLEIEKKWQKFWEEKKLYQTPDKSKVGWGALDLPAAFTSAAENRLSRGTQSSLRSYVEQSKRKSELERIEPIKKKPVSLPISTPRTRSMVRKSPSGLPIMSSAGTVGER